MWWIIDRIAHPDSNWSSTLHVSIVCCHSSCFDSFTGKEETSQISSVLLGIYKKYQVWRKGQDELKRQGNKEKKVKNRTCFCSGNSGNKKGWSYTSITLFNLLCFQIDKQRQNKIAFEQQIRQTFKGEYDCSRGKSTEEASHGKTIVMSGTNHYWIHEMNSMLGYDNTGIDPDKEHQESDSDNDTD